MEFLTQEVIEKNGFTPEQIEAIKPLYNNEIANLKQGWDTKANENAEGILNGAAQKITEITKVTRNQGEKIADFIVRANDGLKTDLETAKSEYAKKLKDFKGDDATKAELDKAKFDLDEAKKTLADYDSIKDKASKYEPLETEYKNLKLQVAFQGVKPAFPETVNSYEAKAKWDEFVKGVESKYIIELVDGEAICKDKENEYKIVKLKDLVSENESIKTLTTGRQQQGTGAKPILNKIEGMPFDIPENASRSEIHQLIENHIITKDGIKISDSKYATKFAELWNKIPKQ